MHSHYAESGQRSTFLVLCQVFLQALRLDLQQVGHLCPSIAFLMAQGVQ